MGLGTMNLSLSNILTITSTVLDILAMWAMIYYVMKVVKNNNRTMQIFKGILLIIVVDVLASMLNLKTVKFVADMFVSWGFLAVIIVFQPEIRALLERLGKSSFFSRITTLSGVEKEKLVDEIVKATLLLSQDQTGALISIEQGRSLSDFIKTGTPLNAQVTAELLTSIFVTSTPLHDGAVIIQGDKVACASAYFPPTNLELPSRFGARHRAAIGISEISDCLTIVVSEETGGVSIAMNGQISQVNKKQLRDILIQVICGKETEVKPTKKPSQSTTSQRVSSNAYEVEVSTQRAEQIRKEQEERARMNDTSVMSKLTIKKQDEALNKKIVPEQVTSTSTGSVSNGVSYSDMTGSSGDDTRDYRIDELSSDLNKIKLPKKKERPVPSYPTPKREQVKPVEAKPVETKVEEPKKVAPSPVYQSAQNEQKVEEPVVETKKVRPLETDELPAPPVVEEPKKEPATFDTTSLDISKIMGYDNELNSSFAMVDNLSVKKDDKEGGK